MLLLKFEAGKHLTSPALTLINDPVSRIERLSFLKCYIWPDENRIPVFDSVCVCEGERNRLRLKGLGGGRPRHSEERSWDVKSQSCDTFPRVILLCVCSVFLHISKTSGTCDYLPTVAKMQMQLQLNTAARNKHICRSG